MEIKEVLYMIHDSLRLNQLLEIAKDNPRDIGFLRQHLSQEEVIVFDRLLVEKAVKAKRPRQIKMKLPLKSTVVAVLDEPRLAAEFSVAMAKINRGQKIAVLDVDRFDPKLDVYLNSKCYIKSVYTHLEVNRTTGLNLLIDAIHKNTLTPQYAKHLALSVNGVRNLHFYSGSYILDDYEFFKLEDFKRIVQFLKGNYDMVVLSTNKFMYDGFTCHALMASTSNIIPISGHITDIKEKTKLMGFLDKKQQVKADKNFYVLFDYNRKLHVDMTLVKELVSGVCHPIPYSQHRSFGLSNHYHLTKHMKRSLLNNYSKLNAKLNEDRK